MIRHTSILIFLGPGWMHRWCYYIVIPRYHGAWMVNGQLEWPSHEAITLTDASLVCLLTGSSKLKQLHGCLGGDVCPIHWRQSKLEATTSTKRPNFQINRIAILHLHTVKYWYDSSRQYPKGQTWVSVMMSISVSMTRTFASRIQFPISNSIPS